MAEKQKLATKKKTLRKKTPKKKGPEAPQCGDIPGGTLPRKTRRALGRSKGVAEKALHDKIADEAWDNMLATGRTCDSGVCDGGNDCWMIYDLNTGFKYTRPRKGASRKWLATHTGAVTYRCICL